MKKLGVTAVRLPVTAASLQAWCWAEGGAEYEFEPGRVHGASISEDEHRGG